MNAPGAGAGSPGTAATALGLTAGWAAALALLAGLWIRTPLSGPGPMFVAWSVPALALAVFSAWWLRRLALAQVRVTPGRVAALAVLWLLAVVALLLTDAAAELALDGFILRRPLLRAAGLSVAWVPGLFGLGLCVVGLAAALEARYRIAHRDPTAPLTASDP
jgi:hypothetical protein